MIGFRELARAADAALMARPTVPLALATLVQVDGSSYQQPGARLLVDAESRVLAGAISGGCLEGDVAARAAEVCAAGRGVRLRYDLRADLETIWGYGAACDGVAHLLLEPLPDPSWLHDADAIRSSRTGGAVLTILDGAGGSSCALLSGSARAGEWKSFGVDAIAVDTQLCAAAADVAQRTGRSVQQSVSGEQTTIFVDPIISPVALHVIGAGRGAESFAQIADALGWDVTVVDHRPAMLADLTLPAGVQTVIARADDNATRDAVLGALPLDSRSAVALLSHIFEVDAAWLSALLPLPVAYVGVLGSRSRAGQLLEEVSQRLTSVGTKLTDKMRHRLHAPIGLDLGGETPASIALSAIAEIEAVTNGRPAGFLRERQSPIHARTPTPSPIPPSPSPVEPQE